MVLFIAMAIVGLFSSTAAAEDAHSYARLDEVSTPHLELDLAIDFDRKQLRGFAEYSLQRHSNSNLLYLDSSQLTIDKAEIWQHDQWQPTKFSLGDVHPSLGQELIVDIGSTATKVRIHYHTATTASGLQWLTPAQTAGKKHPFMFSQSQPIHSRSWIPIQDTPALRLTYNARLTTPAGLLAVMSADNSLSDNRDGEYFLVCRKLFRLI